MKSILKIVAQTSCRSDFDLLSPVYELLNGDPRFELTLLVSGSHKSRSFGHTVDNIRATDLPILTEISTLLDTDALEGRLLNAAHLMTGSVPAVTGFAPDLIIVPGDREDAIALCVTGAYLRIPVAHFFGGDYSGTRDVDNPIRHACSKLAAMHFVTMDEHKRRLMAIGEPPERIHVVGNPALDAFRAVPPMSKKQVVRQLGVTADFDRPYCVLVHHPLYADNEAGAREVEMILTELRHKKLRTFIGLPNTDAGARKILDVYSRIQDSPDFIEYKSLDRPLFVNLMRNASVLVGNSSMGLLEAPTIPLPVVNVGERERGRTAAKNVLFVDAEPAAICKALTTALSDKFRAGLKGLQNPYGDGHTAEKVIEILARGVTVDMVYKSEDPLKLVIETRKRK